MGILSSILSLFWYNIHMQRALSDWQSEEALLERLRLESPDLFVRPKSEPDLLLGSVGIVGLPDDRVEACVGTKQDDLLREEFYTDDYHALRACTRSHPDPLHSGHVLHVNVVADCAHSKEVASLLAEHLGQSQEDVHYVTHYPRRGSHAQRMSIKGALWDRLQSFSHPGITIEPLRYASEHVQPAHLMGVRHQVRLRTKGAADPNKLKRLVTYFSAAGVLPFAPPSQFGSRVIDHKLGFLSLSRNDDALTRTFFTEPGLLDEPLWKRVRSLLGANYGDWEAMRGVVDPYPYTLWRERVLLEALVRDPSGGLRSAWRTLASERKKWEEAYARWVVNRTLSTYQRPEDVHLALPHPFSEEGRRVYGRVFQADGLTRLPKKMQERQSGKSVMRMFPEFHRVRQQDDGLVFLFTLPPGISYETLLLPFFKLHTRHIPHWAHD